MFSGSFTHSVDNKGRTVIPSKFRSQLGERFYITRGMGGCLWIFADDEWREFQKKLTQRSPLDSQRLKLERVFIGSAVECSTDLQGRVFIPQDLREVAGIEDDIRVVGLTDKVEVWSKPRWEEFNNALSDEAIEQLGADLQIQF